MTKDPRLPLLHILEAIGWIEEEVLDVNYTAFASDRRGRLSIERCVEIISEASRRIPDELRSNHPDIEWPAMAAVGNILRHDYHTVDPNILWDIVTDDLPPLKETVEAMLQDINRSKRPVQN